MGARVRVIGIGAVVLGGALAAFVAQQGASFTVVEDWFNGVPFERAAAFVLVLSAGIIVGAGMLVASGIATLRKARVQWPALGASFGIVLVSWLAIPLLIPVLRPLLEEDASDPVRFRHTLRFSGDVQGELRDARFTRTIAGSYRTCGAERGSYSLDQVTGYVGDREAKITISITSYHGPGTYRARHEYGAGVTDQGEAGMNVEFRDAGEYPALHSLYAVSGTIVIDPGERSGSVDLLDAPYPPPRSGPDMRVRITGTWRCLLPGEK